MTNMTASKKQIDVKQFFTKKKLMACNTQFSLGLHEPMPSMIYSKYRSDPHTKSVTSVNTEMDPIKVKKYL